MNARVQTPIDAWLDGGQLESDIRAPVHGWDNAVDIADAKQICRDAYGIAADTKRDLFRIFDLAVKVRHHGISESMAVDLIITYTQPPFSRAQIQNEVHEAYHTAMNIPGLLSVAGGRKENWPVNNDDAEEDALSLDGGPSVWPRPLLYDPKQHNAKLCEVFLAARPSPVIVSDGVIYGLEGGKIWRELPVAELAAEMRGTDPTLNLDTGRLLAMCNATHVERFTKARPFEWIDEPHDAPMPDDSILFRNGLLDFKTGALLPHTGQYFATGLPEYDFDPAATCPTWDRFVAEVLDSSFHQTLNEWLGYVLTPDTRQHKMLSLIGVRRGGKSTIIHIMSKLVGSSHVISRNLNDLGGDFGLEGCLDKKLMVIPDASDTELSKRSTALDRIKCISGTDQVSVNRKGLKILTATLPARLALAANRHPKFLDDSGALAGRELILLFERSFDGCEDRDLPAKLEAELSGIANRALEGLARLRANGSFTIGAKGLAASRELAESQSPALRFAKACLVVTGNPDHCVPLDTVYAAYEEWTYAEGLGGREKRNRDDFKNDAVAALMSRGVQYDRRRWHDPEKPKIGQGRRVRGFFGIQMKPR